MADGAVTPPPGYTIDQPPAQSTLPPGYAIEGQEPEQQPDAGFLPTVGKDVVSAGKGLLDFAKEFVVHGQPYDPENPVAKVLSSQWDSSMQAKGRMMESAEKGDSLGVIQHAAGMIPVASQVDNAMTQYQEKPTHENLAHVVTAALPAFVPSLLRGAGKVTEGAGEFINQTGGKATGGALIGEAEKIAGDYPIDVSGPGDVALETQKLTQSGGKPIKVINDFVRRVTDPDKPPLTFKEARDFYKNASSLSTNEKMNLNPVMHRQVAKFTEALDKSLRETAEHAGAEDQYGTGMKMYAKASRNAEWMKKALKVAGQGAAAAAGGGIVGLAIKKSTD